MGLERGFVLLSSPQKSPIQSPPVRKSTIVGTIVIKFALLFIQAFLIASVTITVVILTITDVHQQLVAFRLNASIVQSCVKRRCGVLKYAITIYVIIGHSTCCGYYHVVIANDETRACMISVYALNSIMLYHCSVYSFCSVLSSKHFYSSQHSRYSIFNLQFTSWYLC